MTISKSLEHFPLNKHFEASLGGSYSMIPAV